MDQPELSKSLVNNSKMCNQSFPQEAYEFENIKKVIQSIQTNFTCTNCHQCYDNFWAKPDTKNCFFCTNFMPMRDTYATILKDLDWWFLKSGETSRSRYYTNFLDNLEKWGNQFHVFPTTTDKREIEELRQVQDWTRNEPDNDY